MLNVIIKMTNACNLKCRYCSLGKKENFKFIDMPILKKIIDLIAKTGKTTVSVIFHGGEPTLIDVKIYRDIIEYAQKYKDIQFLWKMQSNCFCIDDEFIKLLKDKNIILGVSIDGDKESHNKYRIDSSGNGTYDKITENIIKLKKNDIHCSALIVVNHSMMSKSIDFIDWFDKNNIQLKINPIIDCGEVRGDESMVLKSGEYADYIIRVFKYILDNEIECAVQPVEELFKVSLGIGNIHECTFSKNCYERFLCIDYNGDIYPCGRFCDIHRYKLGNVLDENTDIYNSNSFRALKRLNLRINEKCGECSYKAYCNGGCISIRVLRDDIENPLCEDYKKIIDFFRTEGISLYKKYLINKRQTLLKKLENLEQ